MFRLLAQNVCDYALFVIDTDRRVRTWTKGCERLLGYREEEIVGELADRFFTEEDLAANMPEREIQQALESGRGDDDRWHVRKDGSRFWSAGMLTPLRDDQGVLHGFAKIMRDETALHGAEKIRREGEERFRGLMEQAPASIQILAPDGRTVMVNRAWEELWGLTADHLSDYNVLQDPQLEKKGILPFLRRAFAGETVQIPAILYDPQETIPRRSRNDDAARWVSAVAYPLKDAFGQVREIVLIHEDITEKQRSEEALRQSESRLRALSDNLPDGAVYQSIQFATDLSPRFTYFSAGVSTVFGHSAEEVIANPTLLYDRILEDDRPQLLALEADALRRKGVFDSEFRYRRPDGEVRWINARSAPRSLPDGHTVWEGIALDITVRKAVERQLQLQSQVLNSMLEGVSVTDSEGHIVYTNPAEDRIFGYEPGELIGQHVTVQNAYSPAENQEKVAAVIEVLKTGRTWAGDFLNRRKDGSVFTTECQITPLELDGKQFYVCVQEDVTARRHAEQELNRQTKLFKTVANNADSALVMVDPQGRLTFVNPAFLRVTGYTEEEVSGRRVHDVVHYKYPDGRPFPVEECPLDGSYRKYRRAIHGREDVFVRKNGELFPVVASVAPLEEGDEISGCVAEFRDVTQEKLAEQALRRNERTSRFLADASAALSALSDRESTLTKIAHLAVPAFADWCTVDIFGEDDQLRRVAAAHVDPAKVALAHEYHDRFPPDPETTVGAWQIARTGMPELVPQITEELLQRVTKDAERLRIIRELGLKSYIGVPLKVRDRVLGVVTFIAAESGRTFDEGDLAVAEDLAHRAAVAIENVRLYDEVLDADRRKDEFLAMLGHELRNPLAPIRSGLDLLKMSGTDGEIVDLMSGQVDHLVRLVDDLLDVSRILRGRVELKRSVVNLRDVVKRAVETVRPLFEAESQSFTLQLPNEAVLLEADPVRLTQIFANLLHNASKYTETGGKIAFVAVQDGDDLIVRVTDTGIGIDPDLLPHVFDLFTQSTRAIDRAQGGLGIGLTIVRNLVEMHAGTVTARSEGPGSGSEFTLRLPILKGSKEPTLAGTDFEAASRLRILVVDDNVPATKLLVRLFGKLGDHEIVTAYDGAGALTAADAYRPDLILLDIGLPRMDGYEVARRLRANPVFDQSLLVALTGYGTEEDRRRSAAAGFDQHVVKPPSLQVLNEVLTHPKLRRR